MPGARCYPLNGRRWPRPQVVAEHLFQQGCFSVGELFLQEARLPQGDSLKAPFARMHAVLKSVRARPPALQP